MELGGVVRRQPRGEEGAEEEEREDEDAREGEGVMGCRAKEGAQG